MLSPEDTAELLVLVAARDPAAVPLLERLAADLTALAAELRAEAENGAPKAPSGCSDRVLLRVVGPDGSITASTDTGGGQ